MMSTIYKTFFIFITFIFIASCSDEKKSASELLITHVQVEKAIQKSIPEYINSFGYLKEFQDVNIKAQVSGQIEKIHFTEGKNVKKGELLITINPEMYIADLQNDMAVLKEDQADLDLKRYIVKKNENLSTTGAMADQDFKKLITEARIAEAKIDVDKANILRDKINLKYCYIKAPIRGIIGINKMDVGNVISPSDILCNIKSIDPLYVDFTVPEKYIYRLKQAIKKGSITTLITVRRLNSQGQYATDKYPGKIKFLNNTADPTTGTISLRAVVPNKTGTFLPGEFSNIKIDIGEKKNAILIPQNGVQFGAGGKYIFIAEDEKAKRVNITTGEETGNYYILLKGNIRPGDKIIVTGLESLTAGDSINISKKTPSQKTKK